jgi:hypothetical protein
MPTKEAIALAEWREQNWHELDASLKVLVFIRDGEGVHSSKCPYCNKTHMEEGTSAKDKLEAIKGISRLLGAMSTRPADAMKPKTDPATAKAKSEMTDEEAAEVQGILGLRRYATKRPPTTRTLP